ncbi:MAG TPA: hypothetical protein H9858_00025 [Candidatus Blautia stercoravium]|nr:hypothetical protein [Candidatus Blautia stercoravium]
MNCKLAGRKQLAAQGISGRQVHKGVAGGSQRRGSVTSLLSPGVREKKKQETNDFLLSGTAECGYI